MKKYLAHTISIIIGFIVFFVGWSFKRYDNNSWEVGVPLISIGLIIISISVLSLLNKKD